MTAALWIAIACLALALFGGVASAFRAVDHEIDLLREQVEMLEARLPGEDDWRDDQDEIDWSRVKYRGP